MGVALAALAALAWLYLFHRARSMSVMDMGMAMPQMHGWDAADVLLLFVMWAVMMVAMMVPSAAPMILTFSTVHRRRREQERSSISTAVFVAGYLVVWAAYAGVATLAQWGLHTAALLSSTMAATSTALGGLLLVAAGIFQWTPLKRVCLTNCRSPLSFLMTRWREGTAGAFTMGLRHGAYCVGCCWMLMTLLFVAGVMNLAWVAAIAVFVLLEKVMPAGDRIGRVAGIVLVVAGVLMLVGAWRHGHDAPAGSASPRACSIGVITDSVRAAPGIAVVTNLATADLIIAALAPRGSPSPSAAPPRSTFPETRS